MQPVTQVLDHPRKQRSVAFAWRYQATKDAPRHLSIAFETIVKLSQMYPRILEIDLSAINWINQPNDIF